MGVHEGNRARAQAALLKPEGLDGFQPHEALECLLFQTVARRDVNPLATA
jgi:DNA repair protein RadC